MARKRLDELGSLQQAVMEVLWKRGESTVQQTLDAITGRRKPAYTTVLSVLQKLEKAGWVAHRKQGRTYVYRPSRSRAQEGSRSVRRFIDGVFGGDPALLFEHLIRDERLNEADLAELRAMIDRRRTELRDDDA
jgi:BlaI family penicillinase repressor